MTACGNSFHFPKMFKDPPNQVVAGPQKITYYVHPGALSSCGSAVLDARTKETWMNGKSEIIDWTEFDEQTVECVLSYLYTGDYDVREAAGAGGATRSTESNKKSTPDDDRDDDPSASIKKNSPASDPATLDLSQSLEPLSKCISVGLPVATMQTAAAIFTQTALLDCDELLGNTVLMHAKVYCFAHQFLISRLEKLALQRLLQVLLRCNTPSTQFFLPLADAIHLVYESTPPNATQLDDPARQLLSQYVALKYIAIPPESLNILVSEGGEFMIDVAQKLARRIATSDRSTQSLEKHISELKIKVNRLEEGQRQRDLAEKVARACGSGNQGISAQRQGPSHTLFPPYLPPLNTL